MTRRLVLAGRVCMFVLALLLTGLSLPIQAFAQSGAVGGPGKVGTSHYSTFIVAPSVAVTGHPTAIAAGDLNNDGNIDIVVANAQTGTVDVLLADHKGNFLKPTHYQVGKSPVALALGDFSGHGKIDIAVANEGENSISVLLGKGDGTFQAASSYTVGVSPVALAVGDLDGDGHVDILVANRGSNTLAALTNSGDGTFQSAKFYSLTASSMAVTLADFNGDGKLDAVSGNADGTVNVLLNDGSGHLGLMSSFTGAGTLSALVAGDFNRDGKIDLAATDSAANTVDIFLGNGDGTFQAPSAFAVGNSPAALALSDVNGDGIVDLLAANKSANTVSILLGKGDGTFQPSTDYVVGNSPVGIAVGDFNGDGHLDFATANFGDGTVTTPLGKGDGTFAAAQDYRTHLERKSIAVGDLNGDGHPDLVVSNYCGTDRACGGGGTATIFLSDGKGGLNPTATYTLGAGPISVALADVNGDKKLDLIVANRDNDSVMVLLGNGDGTFQDGISFGTTPRPVSIAVGDFNKDGKVDLAVTSLCGSTGCSQRGSVEILLGNGDGSFNAASSYDVGFSPSSVATGDLNADGVLDLVVGNACGESGECSKGSASVLIGDGKGGFSISREVDLGKSPTSIALADLNKDGKLDLVSANAADNNMSVLLGNGDGTFKNQITYAVGKSPSSVIVGDFDGDGIPDLAVANLKDSSVSLLHGNGDGSLAPAVSYPVGVGPNALAALDLTGSGHLAVVTANGNSGGSPLGNDITVLQNGLQSPSLVATTIDVTSVSPSSEVYGQDAQITITAVLSWTGGGPAPTASDVTIGGNGPGTYGATSCGAPVGDAMTCTSTYTPGVADTPGTYTETATFSGDSNYSSSTSPETNNFTIGKAATSTAVTSSQNPSAFGQSVTFTATVTAVSPGAGTPTGTVTFLDGGSSIGTGTLSGGVATFATSTLAVGNHTITTTYPGDGNFNGSTGSLTGNPQVVNKANTTIDVTSVVPASESYEQDSPVTITAVLSWAGTGTAPKASNVTIGGNGHGTYGATSCGPPSSDTLTCTATYTPNAADTVGSYTETGSFSGDTNYKASTSPETNNFTIAKAATTINVTSVSPASEVYGLDALVTITAVLSWTGNGPPPTAGNVTVSGNGHGTYGATSCGAPSGDTMTCTATYTPNAADTVGTYTETATFTADSNYGGSTSPQTNNFTITKAATTIAVTNVNPASEAYGQDAPTTITAVLSWTGSGNAPTASHVAIGGNGHGTYGPTTCNPPSGDTMTCTAIFTPNAADTVGSYTETATFTADGNYSGSTSTQTNNFSISKATSTTVSKAVPNPSFVNQPIVFSATVSPEFPGSLAPTGTVQLVIDGSNAGAPVTLSEGSATFPAISSLSVGSHTVAVNYSGDSNFSPSTGNLPTQTVDPTATATAYTYVVNPDLTITFTATVTPAYSGIYVPTGTVTLMDNGTVPLCSGTLSTVSGMQQLACSTPAALDPGTHSIAAVYAGDLSFVGSTSTATLFVVADPSTTQSIISGQPSGGVSLPNSAPDGTVVTYDCLSLSGTGITSFLTPDSPGVFATPQVSCYLTGVLIPPPGEGVQVTAPNTTTLTVCTVIPQLSSCQNGNLASLRPDSGSSPRRYSYAIWLGFPSFAFVGIGVLFVGGGGRSERKELFRALGIFLFMSLLCLLLACGGGFSGNVGSPPPSGTPVGSYTLSVVGSGTDGSVQIYSVPFTVAAPH